LPGFAGQSEGRGFGIGSGVRATALIPDLAVCYFLIFFLDFGDEITGDWFSWMKRLLVRLFYRPPESVGLLVHVNLESWVDSFKVKFGLMGRNICSK
jgi:hypothetical protein